MTTASDLRASSGLAANAHTVVVLDFETTGLSPDLGDRAIEIGAVLLEDGEVVDRYQSLMNPGFRINGFIESYTGISNAMLKTARPCEEVMAEFARFIGQHNLVAHNASFDRRFLDAEFLRIDEPPADRFACSMLISRRLYPDSPNHKLGTLVRHCQIPHDGTFHRALADSEMTARLWLTILDRIDEHYAVREPAFSLMQKLARVPKQSIDNFLARSAGENLDVRAYTQVNTS